ncbi:thyrotroph embryonic factor-like isoform X2 [Paramacrobiotus metropolitanus]|uniref:thyrotroph embryonic factor-like isoform X2 n=1 Tax=Paramacrobiotus metropolitanus TaxID=2943436 RepID=UPI002445B780|nr:thyrotroph embryonic factor-like isoform X2 [Paramacrobiotus metropolitanus]
MISHRTPLPAHSHHIGQHVSMSMENFYFAPNNRNYQYARPLPAKRKLASSGGNSLFSMNSKKADVASSLPVPSHSAASPSGHSPSSVAAAAVAGAWGGVAGLEQFESSAAQAFLGPSIWDKPNPYESMAAVGGPHDFKLEYMDLDEFLSENGLGGPAQGTSTGGHHGVAGLGSPHGGSACSSPNQTHMGGGAGEDNKVSSSTGSKERESPGDLPGVPHVLNKDSMHMGPDMNGDMAMAPVPGSTVNFDPRRRRFSEEELKPAPMVKKSKKQFVPDELKDEKYWARRRKNNLAAKRSRDARRIKENQIAIRAAYLEKENHKLREQLDKLTRDNMVMREKLAASAKMDLGKNSAH